MQAVHDFLQCATPKQWVNSAINNLTQILVDHAHCEKKAASSAISIIYRYVDKPMLLQKMSKLAREELRHFEQVLSILQKRNITFEYLEPSNYAAELRKYCRTTEPGRLIDHLIISAYIEARSCERFAILAPYLDDELSRFYQGLLNAEARHFADYLQLAQQYSKSSIDERVKFFGKIEARFISSPDSEIRFHSGIPARLE